MKDLEKKKSTVREVFDDIFLIASVLSIAFGLKCLNVSIYTL